MYHCYYCCYHKTVIFDFQGDADSLNSAFRLTYNMVLNLLRLEEVNPEYMLGKSFYQYQNYAAIPSLLAGKSIFFTVFGFDI